MIFVFALVAVVAVTIVLHNSMTTVPDATGDSTEVNANQTMNPTDGGDVVGAAVEFIKPFEGFSDRPYADPPGSGKYSIGYGHQIKPTENLTQVDEQQAEAILNVDVSLAWGCVQEKVFVPLTTNQAAALTSLCYNIGCHAFSSSTLIRKLNVGDYSGAESEFARWDISGGVISSALVSRRAQEAGLFNA